MEKKLERAGQEWRQNKKWNIELQGLIEKCEVRLWEVDESYMMEERKAGPLGKKKGKRWVDGRSGWTGLIPNDDDIHDDEAVWSPKRETAILVDNRQRG